jgi:hypothetical protein
MRKIKPDLMNKPEFDLCDSCLSHMCCSQRTMDPIIICKYYERDKSISRKQSPTILNMKVLKCNTHHFHKVYLSHRGTLLFLL